MANSYLIDLGINDSLQDVVRKCNANFRQVSKQGKSDVRQEATRSDQMLEGAVGSIEAAVDKGMQEIDAKIEDLEAETDKLIDDARKQIEEMLGDLTKEIVPSIGTWMFCDYDPNEKWPGTEWEQISEGTFLMAAGAKYESGNKYGSNTHTLTVSEIPSHNHAVNAKTCNTEGATNYGLWSPGNGFNNRAYVDKGTLWSTNAGSGQPHNNIPQSIAVPLWHRTK